MCVKIAQILQLKIQLSNFASTQITNHTLQDAVSFQLVLTNSQAREFMNTLFM